MNDEAYRVAYKNARTEYETLSHRHHALTDEIASVEERMRQLKETMISLGRLCGESELSPTMRAIAEGAGSLLAQGLTDAVRSVFTNRPEEYLFPSEVTRILINAGYEKRPHIEQNVYTVCRRLKDADKLEVKEIDGKLAYKKAIFARPMNEVRREVLLKALEEQQTKKQATRQKALDRIATAKKRNSEQ